MLNKTIFLLISLTSLVRADFAKSLNHDITRVPSNMTQYHLAFTMKNINQVRRYQQNAATFLQSLFHKSTDFTNNEALVLHPIVDSHAKKYFYELVDGLAPENFSLASRNMPTLSQEKSLPGQSGKPWKKNSNNFLHLIFHNVDEVTDEISNIVEPLQKAFGNHKSYKDPLFFLSAGLFKHKGFEKVKGQGLNGKLVLIDIDVKFKVSVKQLFEEFKNFDDRQMLGITREMQPVYYHLMYRENYRLYEKEHKIQRGIPSMIKEAILNDKNNRYFGSLKNPGYNTGVILLDLEKQRREHDEKGKSIINWAHFLKFSTIKLLTNKFAGLLCYCFFNAKR